MQIRIKQKPFCLGCCRALTMRLQPSKSKGTLSFAVVTSGGSKCSHANKNKNKNLKLTSEGSGGSKCSHLNKNTKTHRQKGVGVQLVFQVSQHIRDHELLKSFVSYFNCGQYINSLQKKWGYFQCTKFSDIYNIIIPFCSHHSIRGTKAKDFLDWVKAAEIINKGDHLTREGSSKIISIKTGMNTGRDL